MSKSKLPKPARAGNVLQPKKAVRSHKKHSDNVGVRAKIKAHELKLKSAYAAFDALNLALSLMQDEIAVLLTKLRKLRGEQ